MSDHYEKLIDLMAEELKIDRDFVKRQIETRLDGFITQEVEAAIAGFIEYLELPQSVASLSEQEEV